MNFAEELSSAANVTSKTARLLDPMLLANPPNKQLMRFIQPNLKSLYG
jgi:hypothetical protein